MDQPGINRIAEALASRRDQFPEPRQVQGAPRAVLDGMQLRLWRRLLLRRFVGARTHQRELDLVLDVFYMKGPAPRLAAYQRADDGVGQRGNKLPDSRRRGALPAFNGKKRLGHRDGNLAGLETDYRAVAADDLVLREDGLDWRADVGEGRRDGNRLWSRDVIRDLHIPSPLPLLFPAPGFRGVGTVD